VVCVVAMRISSCLGPADCNTQVVSTYR